MFRLLMPPNSPPKASGRLNLLVGIADTQSRVPWSPQTSDRSRPTTVESRRRSARSMEDTSPGTPPRLGCNVTAGSAAPMIQLQGDCQSRTNRRFDATSRSARPARDLALAPPLLTVISKWAAWTLVCTSPVAMTTTPMCSPAGMCGTHPIRATAVDGAEAPQRYSENRPDAIVPHQHAI